MWLGAPALVLDGGNGGPHGACRTGCAASPGPHERGIPWATVTEISEEGIVVSR